MNTKNSDSKESGEVNNLLSKVRDVVQSEEDLTRAAKEFQKAAAQKNAGKRFSKNSENVRVLVESIREKPTFTKLVEYSIKCLTNLCVDEVTAEEVLNEGVVDVLMDVIRVSPYNETIQRAVNECLGEMSRNPYIATQLKDAGAFTTVVNSLEKHHEPNTHITSCATTKKMLKTTGTVSHFRDIGGYEALERVMDENAENPSVIAASAAVISHVLEKAPKLAEPMVAKGAHMEKVIHGIAGYPEHAELVSNGFAVIHNGINLGARERIREEKGLQVVVAAMEEHPGNDDILDRGADLLKEIATKADILHSIKVIQSGENADGELGMAVAILGNLALIGDNVDFILRNNGMAALVTAINFASEDDTDRSRRLIESACRAVSRIAKNPDNIAQVIEAGTLNLMSGLLVNLTKSAGIVAEACNVLANIASDPEAALLILDKDGLSRALSCIPQHPKNARVAKAGLHVIEAFGSIQEAGPVLKKAKTAKQIVAILRRHQDNKGVVIAAFKAASAMTPELLKEFIGANGLDKMKECLQKHIEDEDVVAAALVFYKAASRDEDILAAMKEQGAVELLMECLEKHSDSAQVQLLGTAAVAGMASEEELVKLIEDIQSLAEKLRVAEMRDRPSIASALVTNVSALDDFATVPSKAKFIMRNGGIEAVMLSFEVARFIGPSKVKESILGKSASAIVKLCADELELMKNSAFEAIVQSAVHMPKNEPFTERVVFLSEEFAADPERASFMIDKKLIIPLLELARKFPMNDKILNSLVVTIGRLAAQDPVAIESITQQQGAEFVLDAVYANFENSIALGNALNLMGALTIDQGASDMLLKAGAIDALLKLMKTAPNDAEIQRLTIDCLGRLAYDEHTLREIKEAGAIPLILAAMDNFFDIEDVQAAGSHLLNGFMIVSGDVPEVIELDFLDRVDKAAMAFPENADIQACGARVMEAVADHAAKQAQAIQIGGLDDDLVVDELDHMLNVQAYTEGADIAEILEAIRQLADRPGAALILDKIGGWKSIGDLLLAGIDDPDVVLAAALALDEYLSHLQGDASELENADEVLVTITNVLNAIPNMYAEIDVERLRNLLRHLAMLAQEKMHRAKLVNEGALEPLLTILQSHADDQETLVELVRVLGLLSSVEGSGDRFLKDNSIWSLLQAMRRFIEFKRFERFGLYLLGTLALQDAPKDEIVRREGVDVISKVMERWEMEQSVMENANYALSNLSFNSDSAVSVIIRSSALNYLIRSMHSHVDSIDLVDSAATCISNLCFGSDENKMHVARLGSARALVTVVLRNYQNPNLLMSAFRAIGNLAFYIPNIPTIIAQGAVQSIVAGMTYHVNDLELIQIGLGVMTNLAADSKDENQAIMAQQGAVQAIVEVALTHVKNADVEVAAIGCLCNLVQEEYNATMVARQGGIKAVVKAMQNLGEDEELVEAAMRLIFEVSKIDSIGLKVIKTQSFVETTTMAMMNFDHNPYIPNDGLRSLFNLSSSSEKCDELCKRGGVDQMLAILENRLQDVKKMREALKTIGSMARSENSACSMALRSTELIRDALQLHHADTKFCELALGHIGNVCCFDSSADIVGGTDIIPIIISTTKAKQDQRIVVLRGLRALENLAYSSEKNKNKLKREGALLAIETLRKYWFGDEEIDIASVSAMDAIFNRKQRDQVHDMNASIRARLQDAQKLDGKKLPKEIRNMLLAGALFTKHSNNAAPRGRHVYVSQDLTRLCWKDPKKPIEDAKFIRVAAIKVINKGRCTPQLKRKNAIRQHFAREELSFACFTKDRNISLEAGSEQERDEWFDALNGLKVYLKEKKISRQ